MFLTPLNNSHSRYAFFRKYLNTINKGISRHVRLISIILFSSLTGLLSQSLEYNKLNSLTQLLDKANSQKEELKLLSEIIEYSTYNDSTTFNKYINTFQILAKELKNTSQLAKAYE